MTSVFGSIWWLIVSIGILVTFHEFGHFCVARFFGVHVLRFSVGFGKPLLKRVGADGTEYVVSAIPLGGYVKMLDEREYEVPDEDLHRCHNRKPVWQRMLIAVAGPAFNFILAFVLFWAMFVIGQPDYKPLVGHVSGLAAQAGFQSGDRLVRIGDEPVETWTDAGIVLATAAMDRKPVEVEVARGDGGHALRTLPLQELASGLDDSEAADQLGLFPKQLDVPAVVGELTPGEPAAGVLQLNDRIVSINGVGLDWYGDLSKTVQALGHEGMPLHLVIERAGQRRQVDLIPRYGDPDHHGKRLLIGIGPPHVKAHFDALRKYGPVESLAVSAREMRRQAVANAILLKRVFTEGAFSGLHSMVTIATTADAAARNGFAWFLFFLALLSLGLGLINLLPIPILDGGHLLYYLIELVKGRPLSDRTLMVGQFVGLVLLGGLMCVAFYNDLLRHAP